MASRKILRHFLHVNFFMFVNKSSYGFSRSIALAEAAPPISAFLKTYANYSKLNSKPYDYLYKHEFESVLSTN